MSYPVRVFLLVSLLFIATLSIVAYWLANDAKHVALAKIDLELQARTTNAESVLNSILEQADYLYSTAYQQVSDSDYTVPHVYKVLETYGKDVFSYNWTNTEGLALLGSATGVFKEPVDISEMEMFKGAITYPKIVRRYPSILSPTTGRILMPASRGVYDSNGEFKGVLFQFIVVPLLKDHLVKVIGNVDNLELLDIDGATLISFASHTEQQSEYTLSKTLERYPYTVRVSYDPELAAAMIKSRVLPVYLVFGMFAVIMLAALYVIRMKVILPIETFAEAAHRIGRGEKDVIIPEINFIPDMHRLGNEMKNVNRYVTELQIIRDEVVYKNHMLGKAMESADLAKKEAQTARQEKEAFFANMSHDLRTPLNAIIGMSEFVLRGNAGNITSKTREYVQHIHASGGHLLEIVNDILDMAKHDSHQVRLSLVPTDLGEFVGGAVSQLAATAEAKSIAIHYNPAAVLPRVCIDRTRMRQVLDNLLSNAVKYSPDGSVIEVSSWMENGNVCVQVADHGIGMTDTELALAMERFTRLGDVTKVQGSGLGLPIARQLTLLHHAKFDIRSYKGKGTTVTLSFPESTLYKDKPILQIVGKATTVA